MSDLKSHTVPPFETKLPTALLKDLDDRDKYLYEEADKTGQKLEWLMNLSAEKADLLAAVKEQTDRTNGRVGALEISVSQIREETRLPIKVTQVAAVLVKSRIFWGATVFALAVGLPWLVVHAPSAQSVLTWFSGG